MSAPLPVLLWDNLAAAPTGSGANTLVRLPGNTLIPAFCSFLEGLTPTPRSISLYYQGPSLESVPTPCPRSGNRRLLRQVLAARYPALALSSTLWALHPPRASVGGTATILYIAQNQFLAQLQAALAGRQIRLASIHPLMALVEASPPFAPGDVAAMAILHGDHATGVFWMSPGGDRFVAFFSGPDADERMQQALVTGLSVHEGRAHPPLLLVETSAHPLDVRQLPLPVTQTCTVGDFLAAAGTRRLSPLSNLLPPRVWMSAPLLINAATFILLASTLVSAGQYLSARRETKLHLASRQAQILALSDEIRRLEANRTEITRVEALLAELTGPPRTRGRFLSTLGRDRTPRITIDAVGMDCSNWSLSGTVHDGADGDRGALAGFRQALERDGAWTVAPADPSPASKAPTFTLSGTIP